MSARTRTIAIALAVVALFAATTAPANAQEDPTFYVGADAVTAEVTVLGNTIGSFAGTSAVAEQLPAVDVGSFGFTAPDGTVVGGTSAAVDAAGATVRDPEGDGSFCGIPAIPEEVPVNSLLGLVDVCSTSVATLSAAGQPGGVGAANAGGVAVNGQLLEDVIFGLLLDPILEQLGAATAPLEDAVLAPVGSALDAVCDELPAELNPIQVIDAAEESGLPVGDVIGALPNGNTLLAQIDDDCLLALATQVDLTAVAADLVEETVRAALLDALDRNLLEVVLGASVSSIATETDVTIARSELEALSVTGPSLQFLLDAVDAIVVDALQGVIDDTAAIVPAELDTVVAAIPAVDDVVAPVLDVVDLTGLVDDQPLIQVALAASVADARAPLGGGAADTSRSTAGTLVLRISPAIASTLGIPAETTLAPGIAETIAPGTPLESTISVGQVEQLTETLGSGNVATTGARVTATEIALLTELEGGIVVTFGAASARIGGTTPAAPPSLPRTGADTPTVALLVMMTVGLGVLAARRRLTI